jgi:hypothetical protein
VVDNFSNIDFGKLYIKLLVFSALVVIASGSIMGTAMKTAKYCRPVKKNTWLNIYQMLPSTGEIGFEGILQNEM